jgi:hypothetical protein
MEINNKWGCKVTTIKGHLEEGRGVIVRSHERHMVCRHMPLGERVSRGIINVHIIRSIDRIIDGVKAQTLRGEGVRSCLNCIHH